MSYDQQPKLRKMKTATMSKHLKSFAVMKRGNAVMETFATLLTKKNENQEK